MDRTSSGVRVGMDLMPIDQVAESVARFGDRYVRRLFTSHEVASCQGSPSVVAAGLAARFAAKEAAIKVLRPVEHRPDWRSIEIRRDSDGWCALHLTASAARMASEQGLGDIVVSLTHEAGLAAAVVVAVCDPTADTTADTTADRPPSPAGRS